MQPMPRESTAAKTSRVKKIITALDRTYPEVSDGPPLSAPPKETEELELV
jgi:hypothetical protein